MTYKFELDSAKKKLTHAAETGSAKQQAAMDQ